MKIEDLAAEGPEFKPRFCHEQSDLGRIAQGLRASVSLAVRGDPSQCLPLRDAGRNPQDTLRSRQPGPPRGRCSAGSSCRSRLFTAVSSHPEKNRYSVNMSRVNGDVDSGLEGQARRNQGPLLPVEAKRRRKIAKSIIKMLHVGARSSVIYIHSHLLRPCPTPTLPFTGEGIEARRGSIHYTRSPRY